MRALAVRLWRFRSAGRPAPRAPSARRRARAALLAAPLAALLLVVIGVALIERHRPDVCDREYADRLTLLRRLAEDPGRTPALVVGSSRTVLSFAPERLQPLTAADGRSVLPFNFSHVGAGPSLNLLVLERLFRDGVRPGWVVLELMPAFLQSEDLGMLCPFCTAAEVRRVDAYSHAPADLWWRYLRHRATTLPTLAREATEEPHQPAGYGPLGGYLLLRDSVPPETHAQLLGLQSRQYGAKLQNFQVSPGADRAVREAVRLCRGHGARVRFLLSPEGGEYRKLYAPGARERMADYLTDLGRELGVPVTDARDWLAEEDFFDSHHTLRAGTAKFTDRFGREVLAPMVAEP